MSSLITMKGSTKKGDKKVSSASISLLSPGVSKDSIKTSIETVMREDVMFLNVDYGVEQDGRREVAGRQLPATTV